MCLFEVYFSSVVSVWCNFYLIVLAISQTKDYASTVFGSSFLKKVFRCQNNSGDICCTEDDFNVTLALGGTWRFPECWSQSRNFPRKWLNWVPKIIEIKLRDNYINNRISGPQIRKLFREKTENSKSQIAALVS